MVVIGLSYPAQFCQQPSSNTWTLAALSNALAPIMASVAVIEPPETAGNPPECSTLFEYTRIAAAMSCWSAALGTSPGSLPFKWSMHARNTELQSSSDDNIDAVTFRNDIELAQPLTWSCDTLPGRNIVFHAMPRADEVNVAFGKTKPERRLIGLESFNDAAHHYALTRRTTLMDAIVIVGVKRAKAMKHTNFEFALPDGAMIDLGKVRDLPDIQFTQWLILRLLK
jgi:hypothetical protein